MNEFKSEATFLEDIDSLNIPYSRLLAYWQLSMMIFASDKAGEIFDNLTPSMLDRQLQDLDKLTLESMVNGVIDSSSCLSVLGKKLGIRISWKFVEPSMDIEEKSSETASET